MPSLSVDQTAVLDTIYPFLLQAGYLHTLRALQIESRRPCSLILEQKPTHAPADLEATADKGAVPCHEDDLRTQMHNGKWDVVLSRYLSYCTIPQPTLFALYEHIFLEMLQVFQVETAARSFFRNSPVFRAMRRRSPAQHARLHQQLENFRAPPPSLNPEEAIHVPPAMQERRVFLANELCHMLKFVDFTELKRLNRLPWLVAADAALLFGDSPARRPREGEIERERTKAHRTDRTTGISADALEREALDSSALLPKRLSEKTISFADDTDPGLSVTACRFASLGGSLGLCALALKTNGTVALAPLSPLNSTRGPAAVEDPFLTSPGGHAALCIDVDTEVDPPSAEVSTSWVAVGFRGGAVRVFDCQLRKLARKIENIDPLGVHCLLFCGPENLIRGHRGMLVGATFSGNVVLLSIEQGSCITTVRGPHEGGFITSVAKCLVQRPPLVNELQRGGSVDEEVFVSCGDNGTLLRWCIPQTTTASSAMEAFPRQDQPRSTPMKPAAPWRLQSVHSELDGEFPILVGSMPRQCRGRLVDNGADWVAVATKQGTVAVFSMGLSLALVVCKLGVRVASLEMYVRGSASWLHHTTAGRVSTGEADGGADSWLQAESPPKRPSASLDEEHHTPVSQLRNVLVVAAADGVLHGLEFNVPLQTGGSVGAKRSQSRAVLRNEADVVSTVIAEDVGGTVEGLQVSCLPYGLATGGSHQLHTCLIAVSAQQKKLFIA